MGWFKKKEQPKLTTAEKAARELGRAALTAEGLSKRQIRKVEKEVYGETLEQADARGEQRIGTAVVDEMGNVYTPDGKVKSRRQTKRILKEIENGELRDLFS